MSALFLQVILFIRSYTLIVSVAVFGLLASCSAVLAEDETDNPIVGIWITEKLTEVSIQPCDDGYCGYISKVVLPQAIIDQYGDQLDQFDGTYLDSLNKDPSLRDRPLLGLQILTLNDQIGPVNFEGEVYNAEDGETYSGSFKLISANSAVVTGCVMFNLICSGEEWTRLPITVGEVR